MEGCFLTLYLGFLAAFCSQFPGWHRFLVPTSILPFYKSFVGKYVLLLPFVKNKIRPSFRGLYASPLGNETAILRIRE